MTTEAMRAAFEAWYTTHAPNYTRDPIGSRDCSLQWEAWQAATLAERDRCAALVIDSVKHTRLECLEAIRKGETQ